MRLQSQVVIVTGAGSGIGRATAKSLVCAAPTPKGDNGEVEPRIWTPE